MLQGVVVAFENARDVMKKKIIEAVNKSSPNKFIGSEDAFLDSLGMEAGRVFKFLVKLSDFELNLWQSKHYKRNRLQKTNYEAEINID